jgi:hypothetical protein
MSKANRLQDLRVEGDWSKLQYCFYTPAAILDLWCEGLVKACDFHREMVAFQEAIPHIQAEHRHYAQFVYLFLFFLMHIENHLHPTCREQVISHIRSLEGKLTCLEITEVLFAISNWLETGRTSWEEFKQTLDSIVHEEDRDITKLEFAKIYRRKGM